MLPMIFGAASAAGLFSLEVQFWGSGFRGQILTETVVLGMGLPLQSKSDALNMGTGLFAHTSAITCRSWHLCRSFRATSTVRTGGCKGSSRPEGQRRICLEAVACGPQKRYLLCKVAEPHFTTHPKSGILWSARRPAVFSWSMLASF